MKNFILLMCMSLLGQAACASATFSQQTCADPLLQAKRSTELKSISEADQSDRAWQMRGENPDGEVLARMSENDLNRRKRVGEIFGEGCISSADDYASAFIVFQHGTTSDHYLQAFLWSKKAIELGSTQVKKADEAMAIDRYLVSIGRKELFGTQATRPGFTGCWCIQPVEEAFPEAIRSEYRGGKYADYTGLNYLKILNRGTNCPIAYCDTKLVSTPKGTVPGFGEF